MGKSLCMSTIGSERLGRQADERSPQRAVVSRRSLFDFAFDALLLVGFGVAYTFNFTGLAIHEWFGLGFGLALLVHLTLHWDWVVGTTKRMFSTTGRRRLMWIVNLLVLIDLTLCIASGIMISAIAIPALGIHIVTHSGYWESLHIRTAEVAIGLLAAHVALDWRWITTGARRYVRFSHGPRNVRR
jgi:hypothetical protein